MQHHGESGVSHKAAMHATHAVVHRSGAAFLLGEGESGHKGECHSRQQRIFHDSGFH
jgi:hypothetical protein